MVVIKIYTGKLSFQTYRVRSVFECKVIILLISVKQKYMSSGVNITQELVVMGSSFINIANFRAVGEALVVLASHV